MQPLYWNEYDYYDALSICESNHYAEIFKECIDDIMNNKTKYTNNPTYTGWSYNPELYNVNKNNMGIKLYVQFTVINNKSGYILRKKSDKACLYISNNLSDINTMSTIQHELVHIIKLYEPKTPNGLNTLKETLTDEINNYIDEFNITFNYLDKDKHDTTQKLYNKILKSVFYMVTENERLATINAACKQIDVIDKNTVHDVLVDCAKKANKKFNDDIGFGAGYTGFNKSSQVKNIAQYISKIHLLPSLKKICNSYLELPYNMQLLIAYYLNKHRYIKPKLKNITFNTVDHAVHNKEPEYISTNIQNELKVIEKFLEDITEKYKKDLYNGIAAIMEKRKLFLDISEMCELAPLEVSQLFEGGQYYYNNLLI